jgi:predicted exporter
VRHVDLSTDISRFMPAESQVELASLASRLADSELTRTMILTVGAPDIHAAVAAARAHLGERLRGDPSSRACARGRPAQLEETYRLYFPRRTRSLARSPSARSPRSPSPTRCAARARDVRDEPRAADRDAHQAARDERSDRRVRAARRAAHEPAPAARPAGRQLRHARPRFAVLFLTTRSSAFDSEPQARLLAADRRRVRGDRRGEPVPLALEKSGANRFAVAAEAGIRPRRALDRRGVVARRRAVFLAFLRSLRFFLLVVLPAVSGIVFGTAVTRLVFGRIDGVTMAFGASLIGRRDRLLDPRARPPHARPERGDPRARAPAARVGARGRAHHDGELRRARADLVPGLPRDRLLLDGRDRRLAVRDAVRAAGVPRRRAQRAQRAAARRAGIARVRRRGALARAHPRVLGTATLACIALSAVFAPRLRFDDDLTHLMSLDPALRAEEERVRARVAREDSGR